MRPLVYATLMLIVSPRAFAVLGMVVGQVRPAMLAENWGPIPVGDNNVIFGVKYMPRGAVDDLAHSAPTAIPLWACVRRWRTMISTL
jgi:hypothetical protein